VVLPVYAAIAAGLFWLTYSCPACQQVGAPLFARWEDNDMPVNNPKDLRPPVKYKRWSVARQLSKAEIKAAADRAEARSIRATHSGS